MLESLLWGDFLTGIIFRNLIYRLYRSISTLLVQFHHLMLFPLASLKVVYRSYSVSCLIRLSFEEKIVGLGGIYVFTKM